MNDSSAFDSLKAQKLLETFEMTGNAWSRMPVRKRVGYVRNLRRLIADRSVEIANAISEEKQRPLSETLTLEVLAVLEFCRYNEKMFPRWLAPKPVKFQRPGFLMRRNVVYLDPIGLVCLISPANLPFIMGITSLIYLILAGNTVVLKPSELSVKVAPIIEELLHESGISGIAATVLNGGPDAGKWLIEYPGTRKVFFYGRGSSGEKVRYLCAGLEKPCVLETSGGTTAIVCSDADIDLAARGIAWGVCFAGGEACIRTNRIVVEKGIHADFLALLRENMRISIENSYPVPGWTEDGLATELISDAVERGAVLEKIGPEGSFPVLLTGVKSSMRAWSEEIGRSFAVLKSVDKAEDCLDEIKGVQDPLGISIWSSNIRRAENIARDLGIVMTLINDISLGLPCLPWGGTGSAGKGLFFSEHALHEVTTPRWVSTRSGVFNKPKFWWYPYTEFKEKVLKSAAKFLK